MADDTIPEEEFADDVDAVDDVQWEIKGPDPAVWGAEHAAIPATMPGDPQPILLAPGEKGPDPAVWGAEHAALAIPNPADVEPVEEGDGPEADA